MTRRSKAPARVLAVLALVAAVVALGVVISGSLGDDGKGGDRRPRTVQQRGDGKQEDRTQRARRVYEVQPGDNLALIAERTGVSVVRIEQLNPGIDALNLPIGARLKLR